VEVADRLSRWFVITVLGLAAVAGACWMTVSVDAALEHVVALLVVTCPCALGLATPVAMSVGLSRAARAGFFIKHPAAIERLRRVDTIFLDKTGTLTEGRATVSRWAGAPEAPSLALLLESGSDHAVARALRRSLAHPAGVVPAIDGVREVAGAGIAGRVGDLEVRVGNRGFMDAAAVGVSGELDAHGSALLADGLSPLYVAAAGQVIGVAGVGDPLRADARETVQALQRKGIEPWILSGDHPAVVARVAESLGIPAAHAVGGMSPEDKRDRVRDFVAARRGKGRLAMVGDGVNDAAAMALSDVGVAVEGGAGAALLAADVVVTRGGLAPLLDLLRGSRRLLGVIYRNLGFSLLYNIAGATLAIMGLVGPLLAAVLMPISSLTVILSSVLARSFPDLRGRGATP
jgi:Cu2+-exporting ATPase